MNIDLFLTPKKECGLLFSTAPAELPAGILFDAETLEFTIEFAEEEPLHLNITAELQSREIILFADKVFAGFIENGMIAETLEIPLLFLNDPYGNSLGNSHKLSQTKRSFDAFTDFMKRCHYAQPIHRGDLEDEESNGTVLRGMDPKHLEFVPKLIRQKMLDIGPATPSAAPSTAPSAPQFSGPRLGPGGTSTPPRINRPRKMPPQQRPSKEEDDK